MFNANKYYKRIKLVKSFSLIFNGDDNNTININFIKMKNYYILLRKNNY